MRFKAQEQSINPCYKDNKNSSKLKAGENYIYFQLNEIGGFQEAADDEPRSRPSKFDLDRPSSSRLKPLQSARGTHAELQHQASAQP